MSASRSSVSHGLSTSDRPVHPLLGAVVCAAVAGGVRKPTQLASSLSLQAQVWEAGE